VRRYLNIVRNRRAGLHPAPVFVLGNQKAGTTAIGALLAECTGRVNTHDPLYRRKRTLADLLAGTPTVAEFARASPELFKAGVIKDNDFTFLAAELAETFPKAQFVFVVRDPRDNIRSMLNRLEYSGAWEDLSAAARADLAQRLPGWFTILTGASFGEPGGQYIEVLARRWVRAARVYLDAPGRMTLVRYEDFDAAKRDTIESLARTLGLAVQKDITPSQDKQFQPLGDRTVTWDDFFGPDNLARIDRICGPDMAAFGYRRAAGGA
jgi:hypothetical protein